MLAAALVERITFGIAAVIVLLGAFGVVASENPVHSALSLVATLFGVALFFVIQGAYFLAAIQVIVYAGAIVVLFLFVIMLLGVDRFEVLWGRERKPWRRPLALVAAAAIAVLACVGALATTQEVTGRHSVSGRLDPDRDILGLGKVLFTRYVWAFEITGVLLTVAVVGAVVLSRRPVGEAVDLDELPPLDEEELDEPESGPEPEDVAEELAEVDEPADADEPDDETVGAEAAS
jgi:NADH-quinone oxidoreductase subunit J